MNSDTASVPPATTGNSPQLPVKKKRSWWLFGCGGLLAFLLLIAITVAVTIWWIQRPIKPVVLSEKEKAVVEQKVQKLSGADGRTTRGIGGDTPTRQVVETAPRYAAGAKTLQLTERELNGLLNQNTELGKTVRLELDRNAINAYLAVPIPEDFPIGGGKMFRARGRFHLELSQDHAPVAMLEDVTVFGLSLPKEWLGGLKGKNLLADAMGQSTNSQSWKGIKSLRIEPGAIVLEVGD
jgi:hypothetical protein